MGTKAWIPLVVAIVLGAAAAILARKLLSEQQGRGNVRQAQVVVAKQDIAPGSELRAEDLAMMPVAVETLPDGASTNTKGLLGRVARTTLFKGQIMTEALLAPAGTGPGLQALVPEGMRALTVEVNEFTGVGGMLVPGCHVDIISALHDPQSNTIMSRTIVQNVAVSAVGQRLNSSGPSGVESFRSVTLIVNPKDAEAIHVASQGGRPWLVLRGNSDTASNESPGVTMAELRGTQHKPAAPTASTDPFQPHSETQLPTTKPSEQADAGRRIRTVQIIRGTTESTVTFEINATEQTAGKETDGDGGISRMPIEP